MGRYVNVRLADPPFMEGVARILDFGNNLTEHNRSFCEEQDDAVALTADWKAIPMTLRTRSPRLALRRVSPSG